MSLPIFIKIICLTIVLISKVVKSQDEVPYWSQMRHLMAKQNLRIVGGQNAGPMDAPWMVSLCTDSRPHLCGGALIGPKVVITAAHCAAAEGMSTSVKYGGLDRTNLPFRSTITKIILAPNIKDDIAILRLKEKVIESDMVKFIEITTQMPTVGERGQITGWGYTDLNYTNSEKPKNLQKVWMTIISKQLCFFAKLKKVNYICAKEEGASVCYTDSGSPLVINQTLVGVLASGYCKLGTTAEFVSAFALRNWIFSNLIDAPWMVSLTNPTGEHFCSGSLIGPRTVLTAGHCVFNKEVKNILVNYGGADRTDLDYKGEVVRVILAPFFEEHYPDADYDDIAILRLAARDRVIESDLVTFIQITQREPSAGRKVQLTGWGYLSCDHDKPNELQSFDMITMGRERCNENTSPPIGWNYICASFKGLPLDSFSFSDSGSSLVVDQQLIGVVSRRNKGCPLFGPTVFADIAKLSDWIHSNII